MKRILLLFLAPIIILSSCQNRDNGLFCLIPVGIGTPIKNNCDVVLNGLKIGELKEVDIYTQKANTVCGYIVLNKDVKLYANSDFELCNTGIIEDKPYIKVNSHEFSGYIIKGDTILINKCTINSNAVPVDSVTVNILDSLFRHLNRKYFKR